MMKKVIRKITYFFLFVILFGVNASLTSAAGGFNVALNSYTPIGGGSAYYNGRKLATYSYSSTGGTNNAYCIDSAFSGPGTGGLAYSPLAAPDRALSGFKKIIEQNASYESTEIAVRMWAYANGMPRGSGIVFTDPSSGPIFQNTYNKLKSDSAYASNPSTDYSGAGVLYDAGGNTVAEAFRLFKIAESSSGGGSVSSPTSGGQVKKVEKFPATVTFDIPGVDFSGATVSTTTPKARVSVVSTGVGTISVYIDGAACGSVDVNIMVPSTEEEVVLAGTTNLTKYQRMITVNHYKTITTKVTANYNGSATSACPVPCEPFGEATTMCDPTEAGKEADGLIREGNKTGAAGPTNFKTCIVNNTDIAGNDYDVFSNAFCTVACKEDVDYKLPGGVNEVIAGRYFTLQPVKISGKRVCVTSEIDVNSYRTKFNDLSNQIATEYNVYQKNKDARSVDTGSMTTGPAPVVPCPAGTPAGRTCYGTAPTCSSYKIVAGAYSVYNSNGAVSSTVADGTELQAQGCVGTGNSAEHFKGLATTALAKASTLQVNREKLRSDLKKCTDWNVDYTFNPEVGFKYSEPKEYNDKINMECETPNMSGDSAVYCTGGLDMDNDYNCSGSGSKAIQYLDGINVSGSAASKFAYDYYNHVGVKKEKDANTTCENKNQLATIHPTGKIVDGVCTENPSVCSKLPPNIFPIVVEHECKIYEQEWITRYLYRWGTDPEGRYSLIFYLDKLGQFSTSNNVGRFNEIAEFQPENKRILPILDNPYVCWYQVTEEITKKIIGKVCEPRIIPPCEPNCVDIITDEELADVNYFYRTVSLNQMFPNDLAGANGRERGFNWDNAKGEAVFNEINNAGTEVYSKAPEYSYTLTPSNMREIRKYNHDKELNSGKGYADFDLSCFKRDGDMCIGFRSNFLDNSDSSGYFKDLKGRNNSGPSFESYAGYSITDRTGPSYK